jgi:flavin reductase (DIM6/NTAB) family NADH-FMN oxidoreductase RutF
VVSVSPDTFKRAFRTWPSGVAIVTSAHVGELHGMTVSSLASVSLEPPLLSVSCELASKTLALLRRAEKFAVTVLAEGQEALSSRFASTSLEDVRFEGQAYQLGGNGCPLLGGGLAHLECSVFSITRAGDHDLVLGLVESAVVHDGTPLTYWAGSYRRLG